MALSSRGIARLVAFSSLAACGGSSPGTPRDASGDAPVDAPGIRDARPPPTGPGVPWSREPPGDRPPSAIPQLVAITFDDNFGLAHPAAVGGVNYIVDFLRDKHNPAGVGSADDFDGAPAHVTFYHTSIYVVDDSTTVLGGKYGEDHNGRNRAAWTAALAAGHEAGDHTVNHFNGGVVPIDPDPCCMARNWSYFDWSAEIAACRDALVDPAHGIGAHGGDVIGFRTPFLGYNDAVFDALWDLHFAYDTTLPNCFDDAEDGTNCSWPYTLDAGSPDIAVVSRKFSAPNATIPITFPEVKPHPGLWELPPTTLILPPDSVAAQYHFTPGLRARVAARGALNYPSLHEPATGKIAGLDYTLLIDAGITGDEMAAVLEYNLDLHLSGNRSPLIFIGHSHLYTYSTEDDNPDTPSAEIRDERWRGLQRFMTYALAKPEVRLVAAKDVLAWVQREAGVAK